MGFFKSFFSGKPEDPEAERQKTARKHFEIFNGLGRETGNDYFSNVCFSL